MDPNIFMWVAGVVGIGFSRLPKADKLAFASAFLLTCLGVQGNGRCAFCHYDHTLIPFGLAGCILVAGMVDVYKRQAFAWPPFCRNRNPVFGVKLVRVCTK